MGWLSAALVIRRGGKPAVVLGQRYFSAFLTALRGHLFEDPGGNGKGIAKLRTMIRSEPIVRETGLEVGDGCK